MLPPPPCGRDGHASGRRAAARLLLRHTRINPSAARRDGEAAPQSAGPSQPPVERDGGPRGEGGAAPAACGSAKSPGAAGCCPGLCAKHTRSVGPTKSSAFGFPKWRTAATGDVPVPVVRGR